MNPRAPSARAERKKPRASPACAACRLGSATDGRGCPFREVSREAGTALLRQDERPDAVYLVRSGEIALVVTDATGRESTRGVRGPGAVLGIEALLELTAPYSAWTLGECRLCVVSLGAFRTWLGELDTPLGAILEATIVEAGVRASERRTGSEGHAVSRLARYLLEHAPSEGAPSPVLPKRVIAEVLGMRAETLSRSLAELRRVGALAPGRTIAVADRSRLAESADSTTG